jgi:hypothetical protein
MSTRNNNGWIHGGKYVKSSITPPRRFKYSPVRTQRKSSHESQLVDIVWTQLQRLIRFSIPLLIRLVETMFAIVVMMLGTMICGINHAFVMMLRDHTTANALASQSSRNTSIARQSSATPSISNKTPSPSSVAAVTTKQTKSQPVSALRKNNATTNATTTPRRVLFSETEQGQVSVNKIHYDKHLPASHSATKIVRAGSTDNREDAGTPVVVPRVNFNSPTVSFATNESPAPSSTLTPQKVTMQQVRVPPLRLPQQAVPVRNPTNQIIHAPTIRPATQLIHAPTIRPMHNHDSPMAIAFKKTGPSDKSNTSLQSNNYNNQKAKRKRQELIAASRFHRTRPRLNYPTNITRNNLKRKEIDEWVWNAMNDDGTRSKKAAGDGSKENKFKAARTPLKVR